MADDVKDLDVKKQQAVGFVAGARKGFEEPTDKEDLLIPRATLLQALSPEVVKGAKDPATQLDLKPGMIINSLTKEILPSEFIPIFKFTNWIRFNPRNTKDPAYDAAYGPGEVIWRTNDPLDPRVIEESKFGADGTPPLATKFLSFFSVFKGVGMPVVVSFSKTSFKAGKRLLSLAQFAAKDNQPLDMFGMRYALSSVQETNPAGQMYFVLDVKQLGYTEGVELAQAAATWERFHDKTLQVHEEAPAAEAADGI
jgi:hypothetical protein